MTTIVNLKKLLHRKAWESCTSAPAATAAGSFVASDKYDQNNGNRAFFVVNASTIYLYEGQEDAWVQLPASGVTGVFGAGACGEYRALGAMGGAFVQAADDSAEAFGDCARPVARLGGRFGIPSHRR